MDKKRSVIDSTAGMSTALDHREEHEFVRAACLTSLKLCKQLTDEPVIKNTVFHSQIEPVQMFPPVVSIGDVHPVTTSTIQPFILGEDPKKRGEPNTLDRDVLMYYGFPNEPCTGKCTHSSCEWYSLMIPFCFYTLYFMRSAAF